MKIIKIKNFFYIDTLYSLFICLLLENNLDENFYFFSSKFNKLIRKKFKNRLVIKEIRGLKITDYILNAVFYRVIKLLFYFQSKNKKFYIHDGTEFSQYFLNNFRSKFIAIEDGTANYNIKALKDIKDKAEKKVNFSKKLKRNFVYGIKKIYPSLGISEKIDKIILTGILPIPEIIKSKVELINIEEKWKFLSEDKKKEILSIFNIELEEVKKLEDVKNKILLLTQPLSEDKVITEKEKIEIYKEIIKERDIKEIFIKEHPRENTNYIDEFKGIKVNIIKKGFPVEILLLLNIKFDKVITIFSTAALNFKGKSEIEFIGTKNYSKLVDKFGIIEDRGQRTEDRGQRTEDRGQRTEEYNIFNSINK